MLKLYRISFVILVSLFMLIVPRALANCPVGDLDGDCAVGFDDLVMFADQWLDSTGSADLDDSAGVDMGDLAVFARQWKVDNRQITLVINEFMTSNTDFILDPQGDDDDWIEIYNYGDADIDLGGMYITDDLADPTMWEILVGPLGETIVPAGGYLLIWADNDTGDGAVHVGFGLSAGGGEDIGLFDSNENLIDSIEAFGAVAENHSMGRFPNATGQWRLFGATVGDTPTPGESNGGVAVENTVVINELMYHPFSDNDLDEYIELYNHGENPVELEGWQFSDGVEFVFPAVTIEAGGYVVVAADGATFAATYGKPADAAGWLGVLSDKSERVALVNGDGRLVDSFTYADQGDWAQRIRGLLDHGHRGWTWSDDHDGLGGSLELINPLMPNEYGQNWAASAVAGGTPGLVNTVASPQSDPFIVDVKHFPIIPRANDDVSVTVRIVDESVSGVSVTLHHRLDGQETFNTVTMLDDGNSDDGVSGDGVYGAKIPAQTDGSIVEFYVQASDADSRISTYPPATDVVGVMQQVTNLLYQVDDSFDPEAIWTPGTDPIYYIIMTEAERAELADIGDDGDPFTGEGATNAQMNATFISVDGVETNLRYTIGIRNRGNRSRVDPPMNYHVNFRHDDPWMGITAININSKYPFNQVMGSAMFGLSDLAAPETVAARVRVNGEDLSESGSRMYGIYAVLEVYDTDWAEHHYPDDGDGNLYRCTYDRLHGSRTDAYLTYLGTDPADYQYNYVKQTNEEEADWTDIFDLTFTLNDSSIAEKDYATEVGVHADIVQWMRFIAADTIVGNREGGLNDGDGDDYAMYRGMFDPRFHLLPHDLDTVLGEGDHDSQPRRGIFYRYDEVPGLTRLLNNSDAVKIYFNELLGLSDTVFGADNFDLFIDQALGGWVPQARIDTMKQFVADRVDYLNDAGEDIPQNDLTVTSSLMEINGYYRTTMESFALSGTANSVTTSSLLVNGQAAEWLLRDGTWSYGGGGGGGGPSEVLVDTGSRWYYLDNGTDQGTAWREPVGYDDSLWNEGDAQLGYGDGDESPTGVVGYGPNSSDKYVTTYFRQWFDVEDASKYSGIEVKLLRDDGGLVFINGVEVARSNMDGIIGDDTIHYRSMAQSAVSDSDEDAFFSYFRDASMLVDGTNLIAVEIHQYSGDDTPSSSDISFDLELIASQPGSEGGDGSLNPGVNRVLVQAFEGNEGAGKEVERETIDIWYDDGDMESVAGVIQGDAIPEGTLNVSVRDSYLPGVPVLVRVELLNDDGTINRDLWDGVASLSVSDNAAISLSANQVTLYNGLGSLLVTPSGTGDFTLNVDLQGLQASKSLVDWSSQPVNTVTGQISSSQTWSGIYHITGGDFSIPDGMKLTLDPGTLVLIDGVPSGTSGTDIDVAGAIESLGTEQSPVTFTAFTAGQNWGELHHVNAEQSTFEYTNITQAGHAPGVGHSGSGPVFRGANSALAFDHCNLTDNAGKIMDLDSGCDLIFSNGIFARSVMGPEISGTSLLFENSWIVDMHAGDDADAMYIHDQQTGQKCIMRTGVMAYMDDDGLDTLGSEVTFEDFIVRDCKDKGISVLSGEVFIKRCLVVDNNKAPEDPTVTSIAAKVQEGNTAIVHIDQSTIVSTRTAGVVDYGIQSHNKYGVTAGTVIWYVTNSIIDATDPIDVDAPHLESDVHIDYCTIFDEVWAGTDNTNADPLFVNAAGGDYRLQADSPCIDTGDPLRTDSDGSRLDMGYYAYEDSGSSQPGNIQIWTAEQGPYLVSGNVTVPANVTLKIMPGTSVFFEAAASMTVNGRLSAEGTESEQIRFTRNPDLTGGNWYGLQFVDTMQDNVVSYAIVEHAVTNDGLIGVENSNILLDHVTFDHTGRRRLRTVDSSIIVRNCIFTDMFEPGEPPLTDNMSEHIWGGGAPEGGHYIIENNIFGLVKGHNDAIDIDSFALPGPIPQILNNVFVGGGDDALDIECDIHVEGNLFMNFHKDQYNTASGEGNVISAGAGMEYNIIRNVFYEVDHVAQVKNDAFMNFLNNTVSKVTVSGLYFDLPGRSPGRGAYVDGCIFDDTVLLFDAVVETTDLTVNRSIVNETELELGFGNTAANAYLADPAAGDFSLLARSPAKGMGPRGIDTGADVHGVSIWGEPALITHRTDATLNVFGPGATHYIYRLNDGSWSSEQTVDTLISLTALDDGESYTVYVITKNTAAAWQDPEDATASKTWTIDTSHQTLIINEVLAQSRSIASDMIELYYDGPAAIDLGGMRLSDNPNNPGRYVFADGTIIEPDGYLVIYADNDEGLLHTGFSLDGDGEGVYLYRPSAQGNEPIDSVQFGKQLSDISIGRDKDGQWSLTVPTFGQANIVQPLGDSSKLKINEWFTNGQLLYDDDFIELYNPDDLPVEFSGLYITDNTVSQKDKHRFGPLNFIPANGFVVLRADRSDEPGHVNFRLSSKHEILALLDTNLSEIDKVIYYTQTTDVSQGRSPDGADTLEFFANPTRGSANVDTVVINEVLAHSHAIDPDWIELYNVTGQPIDIGGWFLTDDQDDLRKFEIPAPTLVNPGEYVVFYEEQFGDPNGNGTITPFALSEDGEDIILTAAKDGVLTGYQRDVEFGPSATGIPFGRYQTTAGAWHFVPMSSNTTGNDNALPKVGPVVISEIMYNSGDPDLEYVEFVNTSPSVVTLEEYDNLLHTDVSWAVANGVNYTFDLGIAIAPNERFLVVKNASVFNSRYPDVPAGTKIYQWTSGQLNDDGETIEISLPGDESDGERMYIMADRVKYDNSAGWPETTNGTGRSLTRRDLSVYGNDAANWMSAPATPGQ